MSLSFWKLYYPSWRGANARTEASSPVYGFALGTGIHRIVDLEEALKPWGSVSREVHLGTLAEFSITCCLWAFIVVCPCLVKIEAVCVHMADCQRDDHGGGLLAVFRTQRSGRS